MGTLLRHLGSRGDPVKAALLATGVEFVGTAGKEIPETWSDEYALQYRLDFFDGGAIVGCDEFTAEDDLSAQAIADGLFDAVSDVCQSFELRQGKGLVLVMPVLAAMRDKVQSIVIECEEIVQSSREAIASSHRLLERLNELRSSPSAR